MFGRQELPPQVLAKLQQEALVEARREAEAELKKQRIQEIWQQRLEIAYPSSLFPEGSLAAYRNQIERTGNPPDQIENFDKAGIVLQPMQLTLSYWAREADQSDHPNEIGIGGSRGPGKSYGVFAQAAVDDCQRYPGLKVLYLRKSGKTANEQMTDLVKSVLAFVPHKYIKGKVSFPNGSFILVRHFKNETEAANIQGAEYDLMIIEETTHISLKSYQAIRNSSRTSKDPGKTEGRQVWRPRVYNSTNPMGIGHSWYRKRFILPEREVSTPLLRIDEKTRLRKFIAATVDDNRFVDDDYVKNLEDLSGVELQAFRWGIWDISAGAYFDQWDYEVHVIEEMTDLSGFAEIWAGMDYGLRHWNMIYLLVMDGDGVVYVVDELAHRGVFINDVAADFKAMLDRYGLTPDDLSMVTAGTDVFRMDGRSDQTIHQQYLEHDIVLIPAEMNPGSRIKRAHDLSRRLGKPGEGILPGLYVTERCPMLIETLPFLERDPKRPEDVLKVHATETEFGDDPYDALTYALYRPGLMDIA